MEDGRLCVCVHTPAHADSCGQLLLSKQPLNIFLLNVKDRKKKASTSPHSSEAPPNCFGLESSNAYGL